jgi:hypothetical protein
MRLTDSSGSTATGPPQSRLPVRPTSAAGPGGHPFKPGRRPPPGAIPGRSTSGHVLFRSAHSSGGRTTWLRTEVDEANPPVLDLQIQAVVLNRHVHCPNERFSHEFQHTNIGEASPCGDGFGLVNWQTQEVREVKARRTFELTGGHLDILTPFIGQPLDG